jgi:ParB family chromosome partitioning protein
MADVGLDPGSPSGVRAETADLSQLRQVPIDEISPNPDQPRRRFNEAALHELAISISEKGILQPLVVRAVSGQAAGYQIVAGERRWRAAQIAQMPSIPVIVRELSDQEVLEVAIIENIQREELNAIEEATGYRQLIERFGHTQDKIAEALGKSRSHIANLLRLLNLPDGVQNMVTSGTLTAGHARALVTAENPLALAQQVVGKGLSVRETERLARHVSNKGNSEAFRNPQKDADTRALEEDLSANLGMSVVIDHRAGGEGRLTIQYKELEQLDHLCQLLSSAR